MDNYGYNDELWREMWKNLNQQRKSDYQSSFQGFEYGKEQDDETIKDRYKKYYQKEGELTIISTPQKVRIPAYVNKFRRFHSYLKDNITVASNNLFKYVNIMDIVTLSIEVKGEGMAVIPSAIANRLKNRTLLIDGVNIETNHFIYSARRIKREYISITKLLYMCIVESQYITFEEIENG